MKRQYLNLEIYLKTECRELPRAKIDAILNLAKSDFQRILNGETNGADYLRPIKSENRNN